MATITYQPAMKDGVLNEKQLEIIRRKVAEWRCAGGPAAQMIGALGLEIETLVTEIKQCRARARLADKIADAWTCNCYDGECKRCQLVVRYRREYQKP